LLRDDRKGNAGTSSTVGIRLALNLSETHLRPLQIQFVIPGSSAHICGVLSRGDEILAVDGRKALESEIVRQVRGSDIVGSKVCLTVRKGGNGKIFDAVLVRGAWGAVERREKLFILFDEYFGRDSSGLTDDSLDAYFGISCIDRDEQITPDQVLNLKSRLQDIAPRVGAGWIQEMLICANWDIAPSGGFEVSADTENRIVVVGSTGDAATPLEGTRNMVTALGRARLVISPLEQHTTYGTDTCVTEIVDDYLLNLTDGPDITTCDSGA
jgi:hypothetical protein